MTNKEKILWLSLLGNLCKSTLHPLKTRMNTRGSFQKQDLCRDSLAINLFDAARSAINKDYIWAAGSLIGAAAACYGLSHWKGRHDQ